MQYLKVGEQNGYKEDDEVLYAINRGPLSTETTVLLRAESLNCGRRPVFGDKLEISGERSQKKKR